METLLLVLGALIQSLKILIFGDGGLSRDLCAEMARRDQLESFIELQYSEFMQDVSRKPDRITFAIDVSNGISRERKTYEFGFSADNKVQRCEVKSWSSSL